MLNSIEPYDGDLYAVIQPPPHLHKSYAVVSALQWGQVGYKSPGGRNNTIYELQRVDWTKSFLSFLDEL